MNSDRQPQIQPLCDFRRPSRCRGPRCLSSDGRCRQGSPSCSSALLLSRSFLQPPGSQSPRSSAPRVGRDLTRENLYLPHLCAPAPTSMLSLFYYHIESCWSSCMTRCLLVLVHADNSNTQHFGENTTGRMDRMLRRVAMPLARRGTAFRGAPAAQRAGLSQNSKPAGKLPSPCMSESVNAPPRGPWLTLGLSVFLLPVSAQCLASPPVLRPPLLLRR